MKLGLIGKKLGHSWSKEIHGYMADYKYDLVELDENEFDNFVRNNDYSGFNVTIPYKKQIIPYCSSLSQVAKAIGSVNTVRYDCKRRLHGFNTDYYGFIYGCKRAGIEVRDLDVLIFGSGGTGNTVQAALKNMGAKSVTVISRTGRNTYDHLHRFKSSEILINTTPVGTYPNNDAGIVDLNDFPKCQAVFDVVYNPMRTKLIEQARIKGINYSNGFSMLIAQAKYASMIFTKRREPWPDADREIENTFKKISGRLANIILIGMPGSGKSTIGKALSEKTGRPFTDTDDEIQKAAGMSIPHIFEKYGENHFRDLESRVIKNTCGETGRIISVGGGAVLRPENAAFMTQNGILLFIKRDTELLLMKGRPLSKDRLALDEIYAQRKNLYDKYSDLTVVNDGTIEEASEKALNKVCEFIEESGGFR